MKKSALFLLLAAILLSSCFIPDNYEAEVWVHKDGSYEFLYEGELNYVPATEKMLDGEFDLEDLDEMLEISDDLSNSEGFMEAQHIKGGRLQVEVIMPKLAGEDYYFISDELPIFSFKHDEDGNLAIRGMDLDDEGREKLKGLHIDMAGELLIKVDKGVKVISHNADQKKKNKKKGKIYFWELNVDSDMPEMVIKK